VAGHARAEAEALGAAAAAAPTEQPQRSEHGHPAGDDALMCVGVSSAAVALVRLLRELLRFAHKLGRLSWRVVWCATHFGSTHHTSLEMCFF
jgi:hypothetical protein